MNICMQDKLARKQTRQTLLQKVRRGYSLTDRTPLFACSGVIFVSPTLFGLLVCRKEVLLTKNQLDTTPERRKDLQGI